MRHSPWLLAAAAAAFIMLCAAWAPAVTAQSAVPAAVPGVTVRVLSSSSAASPGDLVTHVFRIENAAAASVTANLHVDLPAGWLDLGFPGMIALEPGSAQDVFLTVIVPFQAHGDYRLRVAVTVDGVEAGEAAALVSVRDVRSVDVRGPADAQGFAGVWATRSFVVVNTGNAPDTYILSGASQRGWPVVVEPAQVTLLPGESAAVALRVAVPRDALGTDVSIVRAVSASDPNVADEERSTLRIVGALAQPEPLVAVLQARSVIVVDPGNRSGSVTLSAGGALDPGSRDGRTLSLLMQMPWPSPSGASRAMSRLVYEGPQLRLSLGEVNVREGAAGQLSGVGVDGLWWKGLWSWGVTALEGRRYALRWAWQSEARHVFGVVVMEPLKQGDAAEAGTGQAALRWSAGGRTSGTAAWGQWALEAEAARRLDAASGAAGGRLKGDAIIGNQRLSLTAETWPAGLLSDRASSRLSAAWLAYADWLGNLGLYGSVTMPSAGFAGEERTLEQRLYWGRALGSQLFGYAQQHVRWRMGSADQEGGEAGASVGLRLSPFSRWPQTHLRLQLTVARQLAAQSGAGARQLATQLGISTPAGGGTLSAQVDFRQAAGDGGAKGHSIGFVLNVRTPVSSAGIIDWHARYGWDLHTGEPSSLHSVRYSHQLTEGLSVTARLQRRSRAGSQEWALTLEGAVDFQLPTPIPVKGSVRGRIDPLDTGVGVEGLVVGTGGLRTLTDRDGNFVFPALTPGEHVLYAEGLPARVLTVPEEIVVNVRAGRSADVVIGLQSTAGVEVRLAWGDLSAPPGRYRSLEGVRIQVFDGSRLVTEGRTRADGVVQFPDLVPGTYRLVLDVSTLPAGALALEVQQIVGVGEREWRSVQWVVQELPPVIEFGALKPTAFFTYAPASPKAGEPVTFRERATVDLQRRIVSWRWDLGDGAVADGAEVVHVFSEPGRYTVALTVTDSGGDSDTVTAVIVVE